MPSWRFRKLLGSSPTTTLTPSSSPYSHGPASWIPSGSLCQYHGQSESSTAAATTPAVMNRAPRHVLLSPNTRRPRKVPPKSRGGPARALGPEPPDQLHVERMAPVPGLLARVDHQLLPHAEPARVVRR